VGRSTQVSKRLFRFKFAAEPALRKQNADFSADALVFERNMCETFSTSTLKELNMKLTKPSLALAAILALSAVTAPAVARSVRFDRKAAAQDIDEKTQKQINDAIEKAMAQVNASMAGLKFLKDIDIPEFDQDSPATHVKVPAMHIKVPAIHIHIPKIHTVKNGKKVDVEPINIDIPEIKVDIPDIRVDVPAIHVHVPKTHVHVDEKDKD
jgi:ribosomal protein S13